MYILIYIAALACGMKQHVSVYYIDHDLFVFIIVAGGCCF